MAAARPRARVVATELDPTAARCARRNHVEVFEGSLDEPLPAVLERTVDVMTAVVPYVPTDALRLLPRDVQAFEPRLALDGGTDGTDLLAEVVRRAPRWLRQGAGSCWNSVAIKPNRSGLVRGTRLHGHRRDGRRRRRPTGDRRTSRLSASAPEVDLRKAGGPEGLVQLGAVVDVVGEDPLQDPSAVVDPLLVAPLGAGSPRPACRGSSGPGSARRSGRSSPAPRRASSASSGVIEVIVARAVEGGVRERRRLGAGLAREVAEPEHPLAGGVARWSPTSAIARATGWIASCSSVIAATTSRRRRL